MTLYIILFFIALCTGMALSVYTFGTGGKRKHIFQNIYFSVEDTDGGIFRRLENRKSGTEVFGGH